ncbi:NACHT domain-containing protein [Blastomonas fulva]|uniref:NACHT domain-containing protein n=1 Tax=Blastomonas fulva TaxID=1550728 RepID=UPI003D2C58BD
MDAMASASPLNAEQEQRYIGRRLTWSDKDGRLQSVTEQDLFRRFSGPVVILGDPGMGKTWLMERYGAQEGASFIRATKLVRQPDHTDFGPGRLVIDGLDEIASSGVSDALNSVLKTLITCGKPNFVISCRAADWKGKSAEIDIADEYGEQPVVVDLELLTTDEAVSALTPRIGREKANSAVYALKGAGLENFFQNPLYLDFVSAIVSSDRDIPNNRADLYEQAIDQLCVEVNPYHSDRGFSVLSRDAALEAAGALCAALLVTGKSAIQRVSASAQTISVSEMSELADRADMLAVIGSNLFRAVHGASGQFMPLHRTVAEYLAARWLSLYLDRVIDGHNGSSVVAHRLLALICSDSGVPSSLRGLHAWLPRFSPMRLGPGAIERDPYGILRYGDGDGLAYDQARALLGALRRLAHDDPQFRDGWGRSEALSGLAQIPLADDLRAAISDKRSSVLFRFVVLEAVTGSCVAPLLRDQLSEMLFDKRRTYRERRHAGEALAAIRPDPLDWSEALGQLMLLGDVHSTRVGAELLDDIGYDRLEPELVAKVILADCRLTESGRGARHRVFGSFFRLHKEYPGDRIARLLDAFAAVVLPVLNPKKHFDDGLHDGWSEFCNLVKALVARHLRSSAESISPEQLWKWLQMVRTRWARNDDDSAKIEAAILSNPELRRGVQRIVLFDDTADFSLWTVGSRLQQASSGLRFSDEDAELFLREVVERKRPSDRERWKSLVAFFRTDGIIPVVIRKMARPYAKADPELLQFLVQRPKRQKLDEWDLEFRRKERARKRREERDNQTLRAEFTENIDKIRAGELGWVSKLSRAYLNMYSDLDREARSSDRIERWVGLEIRDAALQGFEAVLQRKDLPSADQIAESYAQSRFWHFVFPMLAGAGQRIEKGESFDDLATDLLSALLIASSHELVVFRETFDGLDGALRDTLRKDREAYEAHVRRMFEPMFRANRDYIRDLNRFMRVGAERPLSIRLAIEWLTEFPNLPLDIERALAEGVIHSPAESLSAEIERLATIASSRLAALNDVSDRQTFWLGIQFCTDFERASPNLLQVNADNKSLMWSLTQPFYDGGQNHSHYLTPSLRQLEWLFVTFRTIWPFVARPEGTTSGDKNPWDATQLLEWVVYQIGKNPDPEAGEVLRRLRAMPDDGYTQTIQANIALQRKAHLELSFCAPTFAEYKAVLTSTGQPRSPADVQAIILAEFERLQGRLKGDPLNPADNFYNEDGSPKTENECRDQMLLLLGSNLPFGIQAFSEAAMPRGKRSDGIFSYGKFVVPFECKGQWNDQVWTAASGQLDRYYAIHHQAAQKGIYVVFWFGDDVPRSRRLKATPKGIIRPSAAKEMRQMLQTLLPAGVSGSVAIVTLDLSRRSPV